MIKLATIFSGIGSVEHALLKNEKEYSICFACDNGEIELKEDIKEIKKATCELSEDEQQTYITNLYRSTGKKNFVEQTYKANYKIDDKNYFQDVRFIDGTKYNEKVDLFVGGSPCQSFSISGKRLGLEDTRGTLFYEYARLVDEIKPKVFIYENVPGMLNHDAGKTWKVISECYNSLGYNWKLHILTATDFGIPQKRTRIFVVGIRKDLNIDVNFDIPTEELKTEVKDYLEKSVDEKYYHKEKGFKWITKPLSLKKRVSINAKISRTQAANQQFNWCGDMRFETDYKSKKLPENIYVGQYNNETGVARKLTPRECLRLMGYTDKFKIVVPDQQMYRQSGNSIVVNVMQAILKEIYKTGVFDNE